MRGSLSGGTGNDTYRLFDQSGNSSIQEGAAEGTADVVAFGSQVSKSNTAIFLTTDGSVQASYGNASATVNSNSVEQFQQSDGSYLTAQDIANVTQQLVAFAQQNDIALNSAQDVRGNQDLMAIMSAAWHH